MRDTAPNHNTGWRVVRMARCVEYYTLIPTLYLQCRTKHCIETRVEKREGYWYPEDFD